MKSDKQYVHCIKQKITKKVYNNIINSIKVRYEMDTIFINSRNSKKLRPHSLLLNFFSQNKIDKYVTLSNLTIQYTWSNT